MKHLKLFIDNSQYLDFVNSNEFVLPNVACVINSELIHFNPVPEPPKFYIEGTECQFEEGMTWGEWISSSYNTCGLEVCYSNYVGWAEGGLVADGWHHVCLDDIIMEDQVYTVVFFSPGE